MTKARYKVVADGNRSFEGEMNVPSWYFDDGDQLVVGSPPPEDDSLMLLLLSSSLLEPFSECWDNIPFLLCCPIDVLFIRAFIASC